MLAQWELGNLFCSAHNLGSATAGAKVSASTMLVCQRLGMVIRLPTASGMQLPVPYSLAPPAHPVGIRGGLLPGQGCGLGTVAAGVKSPDISQACLIRSGNDPIQVLHLQDCGSQCQSHQHLLQQNYASEIKVK
jgi:hypothetical protein